MGSVHSNYLLFHDHSCRPLIISCIFYFHAYMNITVHYNFLQLPNIITTFQKLNSVAHFTEKNIYTTKFCYPHLQNYLD